MAPTGSMTIPSHFTQFDLSAKLIENKRLTGVQDLSWALINTPSFLFNR